MNQPNMKIFLAGIPTEPDVRELMEKFNDYTPGTEVLYTDIADLVHVDVRTSRFEVVLASWRKRIRKDHNVVFKRFGDRLRFLAEMERVLVGEPFWPFLVRGKAVQFSKVSALTKEKDFDAHQKFAADHGFMLLVKRARIGQKKHIRVRPRFDEWSTCGTLNVWDDQITLDALLSIYEYAGQYKGLGDWRPGGKTPGPYGTFTAEIKEI